MDFKPSFKDETGILTDLVMNKDSEEILKTCIMEFEESKQDTGHEKLKEFYEVLDSYDMEVLYNKYGMSGVEDVDKLDINRIIGSL